MISHVLYTLRWHEPNPNPNPNWTSSTPLGGMKPFFVCPVSKLVKSEKLSLEQLALVETLCIGAHAVFRGTPRAGTSNGGESRVSVRIRVQG